MPHKKSILTGSNLIRLLTLFLGVAGLLFTLSNAQAQRHSNTCLSSTNLFSYSAPSCSWSTHIYFSPEAEIVTCNKNSSLLYRKVGFSLFQKSPLYLKGPHSILFNSRDQLYYINDTDNNRVLTFSSLESGTIVKEIKTLAGLSLHRPHDIVQDPGTGWLFTLNPSGPTVLRFSHTGLNERALDLSKELGYSRSLSIVNGKLYVVGSSAGKVVEIEDFETGQYKVYQSAGKKKTAHSGNWHTHGLIPNDIEFYQGNWYVTSFFHPSSNAPHVNLNTNKFIRFKSWQDFENGSWEDLSHLLPDGLVPYFLTIHKEGLYIALFNFNTPGQGDTIFKLSNPCGDLAGRLLPLLSKNISSEDICSFLK